MRKLCAGRQAVAEIGGVLIKLFSVVLGVSLRPLRLVAFLTQRTLRYAENAEKYRPI